MELRRFQHRREILRAIWSYTKANAHYNSDIYAKSHPNSNSYGKCNSNCYAKNNSNTTASTISSAANAIILPNLLGLGTGPCVRRVGLVPII